VPAEPGWHCSHWLFCSAEPSAHVQAVLAALGELPATHGAQVPPVPAEPDGHATHTPFCICEPSAQAHTVAPAVEVLPDGHAVSAVAPGPETKKPYARVQDKHERVQRTLTASAGVQVVMPAFAAKDPAVHGAHDPPTPAEPAGH
jgi:hypothetical protein